MGKLAVVTGAGSGIGAAIAMALASEECRVIAVGRRTEALESTVSSNPELLTSRALDVTDHEAVSDVFTSLASQFGHIDVLVNSAGANTAQRSAADVSADEWSRLIDVNVTGAFHCIQAVIPMMRSRGSGTIVNISSVAGKRAIPLGGVAYNASKFAMTALGATVGDEERESGVRVTNIFPGEVETPILDARPEPVSKEHRAKILQPEDVAEAVLLACVLPERARIPELVIVPTLQSYV